MQSTTRKTKSWEKCWMKLMLRLGRLLKTRKKNLKKCSSCRSRFKRPKIASLTLTNNIKLYAKKSKKSKNTHPPASMKTIKTASTVWEKRWKAWLVSSTPPSTTETTFPTNKSNSWAFLRIQLTHRSSRLTILYMQIRTSFLRTKIKSLPESKIL